MNVSPSGLATELPKRLGNSVDMANIASCATAARKALLALEQSVQDLPPPKFNFARSNELLDGLAKWAANGPDGGGFAEAAAMSRALEGGLEKACVGRGQLPIPGLKVTEAPLASPPIEEELSPIEQAAAILGSLGGRQRSEAQKTHTENNLRKMNSTENRAKIRRRRADKAPGTNPT